MPSNWITDMEVMEFQALTISVSFCEDLEVEEFVLYKSDILC